MGRYDEYAGLLFDYAVSRPEGFTNEQAMRELGIKHLAEFNRISRALRIALGDSDTINLVCDPQQQNERWLYRLVGSMDEAQGWVSNRTKDLEARLETQHGVSRSLVASTDGRSIEGRKARKISKTLGRLLEDLEELRNERG